MNLEELRALENEWLQKQPHGGWAEERDALYKRIGMYDAWQEIFRQYVVLAREGEREAVKRALHLAWADCSQAFFLTGIMGLDDKPVKEVLGLVNELAKKGDLDTELEWMLAWYYYISGWYLDRFNGFEDLKKVSKGNPFLYKQLCLESSFDNRGQLSKYWKAMQDNLTGKIDKDEAQFFSQLVAKIWRQIRGDHCP